MKDHICEESPHVDGLCIECWKARAEKAEAAIAHLQANAQADFERFTKAQADLAKAEARCAEFAALPITGEDSSIRRAYVELPPTLGQAMKEERNER